MIKLPTSLLNRILLALLFSLMTVIVRGQQSPQFTQFMFNNLIVNPAYAGAERIATVNFLSRSQWTGVEGSPSTLAFAAHTPVKNIGLGITFLHDRIGVHKTTTILTNYAYHIRLSDKTTISMGLQAGMSSLRSDYTSLSSSAGDPKASSTVNETFFDFGGGIYLQGSRLHVGISAPSLLSNTVHVNDSVAIVFNRSTLYGYLRYRFPLNEKFDLDPGLLVKYFQDLPAIIDVNAIVTYRKVIAAGLGYRHKESLEGLIRLQLTHQLQLAYSYDYPINLASRLSTSSHEVMIQYQFKRKERIITSPR
jgi:type IX secretion system PorP/SprF family membrane protein